MGPDDALRALIREEVKAAAKEIAEEAVAFPDLAPGPDHPPLLNRGTMERLRIAYTVFPLHQLELEVRAVDDRTLEIVPELFGFGRGRPTRIRLA